MAPRSVVLALLLVPQLASAKMLVPLDDPRIEPDPPEPVPPAEVAAARPDPPPPDIVEPDEPPPCAWRLELDLGWRVGSQLVDGMGTGTVHAAHVAGGVRWGRKLLSLEYQLSELQLDDTAFASRGGGPVYAGNGRGLEHRLGANVKYSFARFGESDGGVDAYVEGGLGVEHDVWDSGGVLTRPDVSLGIGSATYGWGEHRHGGVSMGLRVTLARRDDLANAGVACGGPCDHATTPTGIDRSFMFDITVMLGN